ncbi:sel1 repeat family protein [Pseudomonas xanthosomatis]|uniref:tetratricopeptide repeat protein n=1 Tax=Pseudomonas xanthosomatis TaxID=2842356 RepID=UPI001C3C2BFC|nr:sel1 repeat family protein [Pseudomonas xanthosomatis]QXH45626.1 sel1 repeat family protein [Pseudomonas xanthosomatis]
MSPLKAVALALVLALPWEASQAVVLTAEQEQAKAQGMILYRQKKTAENYLRVAAQAGDSESQYYLAEELTLKNRYMTIEAHKWYVAAAEQGDYYAMYQLASSGGDLCDIMGNCPEDKRSPKDWYRLARSTTERLAEQGDGEAMYMLALLGGGFPWLKRSAEAGYPEAEYRLAIMYKDGDKFYFPPWKKSEKIEALFKHAGESGHRIAMDYYFDILEKRGETERLRKITIDMALEGDAHAVSSYAAYLAHAPEKLGFELDLVKGYGLMYTLLELDGGGGLDVYVARKLERIGKKMTSEQIEQAKEFAAHWKATHPPLSFFTRKLEY